MSATAHDAHRRLWLIRHAEAATGSPTRRDFDRPLSSRGETDVGGLAAWLSEQDTPPDWIVSSDAVRALSTATLIKQRLDALPRDDAAGLNLVVDRRLYDAVPNTMIDVIREVPPDCRAVAVVAHNPAVTELANLMSGSEAVGSVPPGGILEFELTGDWHDLHLHAGQVTFRQLMTPARLWHGT